jgi:hypothetical protein
MLILPLLDFSNRPEATQARCHRACLLPGHPFVSRNLLPKKVKQDQSDLGELGTWEIL